MIPSYGKVWALGHKETARIFDGPWTATEKIDGSQFSFLLHNGQMHFRSKGAPIDWATADKLFKPSMEGVMDADAAGDILPDVIYRGEAMSKPKHNTLAYDTVPPFNIVMFDVQSYGIHDTDALLLAATKWPGLWAPTLGEGKGECSQDDLNRMLDTTSCLGGQKVEGVVFKNYRQYDSFGHTLKAKYVSEAFKEVHRRDWKVRNPNRADVIQMLVEELRTPARWEKAVLHLQEAGDLEGSPKDIGSLIAEVKRDVAEEERDYIAEKLLAWGMDQVLRGAAGGVAEWYKQKLASEVLTNQENPSDDASEG